MAPKLMLNKFDPVAAFFEDLQRGTDERLDVYRALRPEAEDEYGMTMLAHAARAGDSEAVELMLERGADPNAPDRSGRTPLFHVAEGPHDWVSHPEDIVYIVEDLLKYGADVDHTDDSGKTRLSSRWSGGCTRTSSDSPVCKNECKHDRRHASRVRATRFCTPSATAFAARTRLKKRTHLSSRRCSSNISESTPTPARRSVARRAPWRSRAGRFSLLRGSRTERTLFKKPSGRVG